MGLGKISVNAPNNFIGTRQNNIPKLTTPFIGVVKDNTDADKMNKLKVWIPELSQDDEKQLYVINWCSPFAGATKMDSTYSQASFGLWFSPPPVGCQVVVMFINGDPNMGIYIGGMFDQFMNCMVPGIPKVKLDTTSGTSTTGCSVEYNKTDKTIARSSTDPKRPGFKPLVDALAKQGLSSDHIRGTSTSSGRRASPSDVNGILTQGGNQFVMDDDTDNAFIRLRTKNGTQVLINDTVGNVYINSKCGNSWVEISDSGIDIYSTRSISARTSGDYNVHADGNINMFAGKYFNVVADQGISIAATESINFVAGNQFNVESAGAATLLSEADLSLIGYGDVGLDAGSSMGIRACSSLGITCCDNMFLTASIIKQNSGSGPTPGSGTAATVKTIGKLPDVEVSSSNGYNPTKTKTIVSRLPSHEPFVSHPYVSVGNDSVSLNTDISTRAQIGTSGTTAPSSSTDTNNSSTSSSSGTSSSGNTSSNSSTNSGIENKTISTVKVLPNGNIQTVYTDGTTVSDVYDSSTGKYYYNGDKSQPMSAAEIVLAKSSAANHAQSDDDDFKVGGTYTKITNSGNSSGLNGLASFNSATSKGSSLLGLANVGVIASGLISNLTSSSSSAPSVMKTTSTVNASSQSWLSPVTGTVSIIYSSDNYGPTITLQSTHVLAPKAGTITWAGDGEVGSMYNGYTGCVVIDHGDGTQSLISNLTSISVKVNDTVTQKQGIGAGSTSKTIHFEIRTEGVPTDPSTYISAMGTQGAKVTAGVNK